MLAVSTGALVGIVLAVLVGLFVAWHILQRFLGFSSEGRSGELSIQRWIDVARKLAAAPRNSWKKNRKGAWYTYDLDSKTEIEFSFTPEGFEDKIIVTLDDVKVLASFRQGSLMFLKFDGSTLDDTTREFRYTGTKWTNLLNTLREKFGEEAMEVAGKAVDSSETERERDERRLALAEKKAKQGGGAVPRDVARLAERHKDK